MAGLGRILFEELWFVAGVAAAGFVVLLFVGQRMDTQRRGRLWLLWMTGCAALFFLQKLVVTQSERVQAELRAFVGAVEREDHPAVARFIATDYDDGEFDRAALLRFIADRLASVDVHDTRFNRLDADVDADGGRAELHLVATATVHYHGAPLGRIQGEWTLQWRRSADGWRIGRIVPRRLDRREVNSWNDLGR